MYHICEKVLQPFINCWLLRRCSLSRGPKKLHGVMKQLQFNTNDILWWHQSQILLLVLKEDNYRQFVPPGRSTSCGFRCPPRLTDLNWSNIVFCCFSLHCSDLLIWRTAESVKIEGSGPRAGKNPIVVRWLDSGGLFWRHLCVGVLKQTDRWGVGDAAGRF